MVIGAERTAVQSPLIRYAAIGRPPYPRERGTGSGNRPEPCFGTPRRPFAGGRGSRSERLPPSRRTVRATQTHSTLRSSTLVLGVRYNSIVALSPGRTSQSGASPRSRSTADTRRPSRPRL